MDSYNNYFHKVLIILLIVQSSWTRKAKSASVDPFAQGEPFNTSECQNILPKALQDSIMSYSDIVNKIYATSTQDPKIKGSSYSFLKTKLIPFGPRLIGTQNLENALNLLETELKRYKFMTNVHKEEVKVPKLVRIYEGAKLIINGKEENKIKILGTGKSVSTSILGLKAEILFVPSTSFLLSNKEMIKDKIVVIKDISSGTTEWKFAEESGAKAIVQDSFLVYSKFTRDLFAARTGSTSTLITIPVVVISHADLSLIQDYSKRSSKVEMWLKVIHHYSSNGATSNNVIGDYPGKTKSNEFVITSAHVDSWDLAPAAQDDAFGVALTYQMPKLLNYLKLKPKRTIRTIFWTGEEFGLYGSKAYAKKHANELDRISTVLEADHGCFEASGWAFGGNKKYGCIMNAIDLLLKNKLKDLRLLDKVNTSEPEPGAFPAISTDVGSFFPYKIPGAKLNGDTQDHDWHKVHHTKKDVLKDVESSKLDECLALYTSMAYVMADLDMLMPRLA